MSDKERDIERADVGETEESAEDDFEAHRDIARDVERDEIGRDEIGRDEIGRNVD
jgi:hypothetical protein